MVKKSDGKKETVTAPCVGRVAVAAAAAGAVRLFGP
ncbi:trans-sialidase, putative, partial [Trypanosoma cruzi marinkellei]